MTGLSPYVDPKSIYLAAAGDYTVLSVNHQHNYLNKLAKSRKIDSPQAMIQSLTSDISMNNHRLAVFAEKERLLTANRRLSASERLATLDELRVSLDFFDEQFSAIKSE